MSQQESKPGLNSIMESITDRAKDVAKDLNVAAQCIDQHPGDNDGAASCILSHLRGEDSTSKVRI